jgi:hypothetical protein
VTVRDAGDRVRRVRIAREFLPATRRPATHVRQRARSCRYGAMLSRFFLFPGCNGPMRAKVGLFTLCFMTVITLLHIQLNVGWETLADEIRIALGGERKTLIVGFLPVT